MFSLKNSLRCPVCGEKGEFKFIRGFLREGTDYSLYQCPVCQVQFWWPLKNPNSSWYEKNNPYNVRKLAGLKIKRGYHKKFLKRHKNFSSSAKILDLGCGTGEFLDKLKKRGCEVFGMDFDSKAVFMAKDRFGLENLYALSFSDFFKKKNLPKFDMITFFEVLEHLEDPVDFVKNVKKILKPGGKVVLTVPSAERMMPNHNSWDFPPHHFTRWNREAVLNFFEKQGFSVSYITYVEKIKILSESISGKFKTGLVGKSLVSGKETEKFLIIPKLFYFLGNVKDFILGKIPAIFLCFFSKVSGYKNGIMFIELKEKTIEKKKRVIFLIPTLSTGGGERVLSELSLGLPDSIEKIIVLFKNQISYPYKGRVECLNIPLSNPIFKRIYYFFVALLRFRKLIKNENPDLIVSFGVPANIINILVGKEKAVIRIDNTISLAYGFLYKFLIKIFYNKAKNIVCVSKSAADDLIKNFKIRKDKIRVIYNPLNTQEIRKLSQKPIEKKYQDIFENPVVITMGRLARQKSQWYLIRSFAELKKEFKKLKLVILGEGELESDLKKIAEDLGIKNDIYFLGWQKNPFIFLAKSKLFVLSSLWEGLPYVLLEAMACGLPVVSVDCKSGPREILAPKTEINFKSDAVEVAEYGVLTPVFDGKKYGSEDALTKSEELLKQAMKEVLTNKKTVKNLSKKSLQRAEDFDIINIIKEWEFLQQ